jgi:Phage integrase family
LNFRDLWLVAFKDTGIADLHLHDLRHTGNTMAAATGASLRELMERMGHSNSRAALIYQHASRDWDEAIAAAMGTALATARKALGDRHRARNGHADVARLRDLGSATARIGSDLGFRVGAGDRDRTGMTSLEGWGSTIELRPRGGNADML